MGYHTRPEMIGENLDLLSAIRQAVEKGEILRLDVEPDRLSSEQYSIRRILKATEIHRTAYGGEFCDLGKMVRVEIDPGRAQLVIRLKAPGSRYRISRVNENDAINSLTNYQGSMNVLEFYPSEEFTEESFEAALAEVGWILYRTSKTEAPDGKVSYAVEREEGERSAAFDLLNDGHGY